MKGIYRVIARALSLIFKMISKNDRVRVIIRRNDDKILLVKNRFSRQEWALPGGGVKRHERYEQAAAREVLEEVGISVENLQYLGKANSRESYIKFPVRVFTAEATNYNIKYNFEIMDAQWFNRKSIPKEYTSLISKIMA